MEILGERPPPLPPKNRTNLAAVGHPAEPFPSAKNFGLPRVPSPERNGRVTGGKEPQLRTSAAHDAGVGKSPRGSESRDGQDEAFGPRIVTWTQKNTNAFACDGSADPLLSITSYFKSMESEDEFLYENVSNAGTNYLEYKLNGMIDDSGRNATGKSGKRGAGSCPRGGFEANGDGRSPVDNRQIEVHRMENKTVVKISIRENPTESARSGPKRRGDLPNGRPPNVDLERPRWVRERCRGFRDCEEPKYENLPGSDSDDADSLPEREQLYANLDPKDSLCDRTYENQDFGESRKARAARNGAETSPAPAEGGRVPGGTNASRRSPEPDQIYENRRFGCEEAAYENCLVSGAGESRPSPEAPRAEVGVPGSAAVSGGSRVSREEQPGRKGTGDDFGARVSPSGGEPLDLSHDRSRAGSAERKIFARITRGQQSEAETEAEPQGKKSAEDSTERENAHGRAESPASSGVGLDGNASDGEESNISCDSLDSTEPNGVSTSEDHGYNTPTYEKVAGSPVGGGPFRGRNADACGSEEPLRQLSIGSDACEDSRHTGRKRHAAGQQPPPPPPKPRRETGEVACLRLGLSRRASGKRLPNRREQSPRESDSERAGVISAIDSDTDRFYKFHLFENRQEAGGEKTANEDETFAGVKDYLNGEKQAAIKSAKGTIRGVKNRVKAGIATFLQMHENKSYKDRDAGKIVVYSTTMGIVRETYHKCLKVKQILRTLMVKFEERDVFMSTNAQDEIRERMKCDAILVPQVFVEGQHIGDAETIERLNESGELRRILRPYKSVEACTTCQICGGYRLLPCSVCKGSKKSVHRNHFTAEFVALKCMNCDQVGLTKCYAC